MTCGKFYRGWAVEYVTYSGGSFYRASKGYHMVVGTNRVNLERNIDRYITDCRLIGLLQP